MGEKVKLWGIPGSGKTRRLLDIVDGYLDKGMLPSEIIFTSFTRSAANEAVNRAMVRFGYSRDDFPYFGTEHSICFHLLGLKRSQVFNSTKMRNFASKYGYELTTTQDDLGRFNDLALQTTADYYEFFVNWMENRMLSFNDAYNEFIRQNDPPNFTKNGAEQYLERRTRYKQENKLWSFSDMIVAVIQQGLFPSGAKVLIADECQDMSPLLYELIGVWSNKVDSYYIAGDPYQALFVWSGASPELFLEFPGDEEVLNRTYRFGEPIKDYACSILKSVGITIPDFNTEQKQATLTKRSFFSVKWDEQDDAFLLVRTRWLISQIADYFISMGIPFAAERGKQSPLSTSKGRAFLSLIKLSRGESITQSEVENLVKYTRKPYLERGTKTKVKKLVDDKYSPYQLKDIGFTTKFLSTLTDNPPDILCQGMETWEKSYLLRVYRKYGIKPFEKNDGLKVLTYHKSKGREAKTVFLCPDYTNTVWNSYIKDRKPEHLLGYVGATRAKENLIILCPLREQFFPFPRIGGGNV